MLEMSGMGGASSDSNLQPAYGTASTGKHQPILSGSIGHIYED